MITITEDKVLEVLNTNSLVIIKCGADWCGPCKLLKPVLEELESKTSIKVYDIDVDDEDNSNFVDRFEVKSLPTLLFFRDKNLVSKQVGYMDLRKLCQIIDNL